MGEALVAFPFATLVTRAESNSPTSPTTEDGLATPVKSRGTGFNKYLLETPIRKSNKRTAYFVLPDSVGAEGPSFPTAVVCPATRGVTPEDARTRRRIPVTPPTATVAGGGAAIIFYVQKLRA